MTYYYFLVSQKVRELHLLTFFDVKELTVSVDNLP
jgi:hypothetical protein